MTQGRHPLCLAPRCSQNVTSWAGGGFRETHHPLIPDSLKHSFGKLCSQTAMAVLSQPASSDRHHTLPWASAKLASLEYLPGVLPLLRQTLQIFRHSIIESPTSSLMPIPLGPSSTLGTSVSSSVKWRQLWLLLTECLLWPGTALSMSQGWHSGDLGGFPDPGPAS